MSDMIDMYRSLKDEKRLRRQRFGVQCPMCVEKLPKAQPKVLLQGEVCRAHKPHFRDPRPMPTAAEYNEAMAGTGWTQKESYA